MTWPVPAAVIELGYARTDECCVALYQEGWRTTEIARRLKISPQAVSQHVLRAKEAGVALNVDNWTCEGCAKRLPCMTLVLAGKDFALPRCNRGRGER